MIIDFVIKLFIRKPMGGRHRRFNRGCDLCILKNLQEKEIPTCFYKDIDHPKPTKDWHYEDFAALVLDAKEKGKL